MLGHCYGKLISAPPPTSNSAPARVSPLLPLLLLLPLYLNGHVVNTLFAEHINTVPPYGFH